MLFTIGSGVTGVSSIFTLLVGASEKEGHWTATNPAADAVSKIILVDKLTQ